MHVAVRTLTSTKAAAGTVRHLYINLSSPRSCTTPCPSAVVARPAAAAAAAATPVRRMPWFGAQQRAGADITCGNSTVAGSSTRSVLFVRSSSSSSSSSAIFCLLSRSGSGSSSSSSSSSSRRRSMLMSGAGSVFMAAGVLPLGWSGAKAATRARHMATAATGGAAGADTGVLVVYVTVPTTDVAGSIAEQLVNSKLAACVNILPGITSVYTWKGKVEKDSEVLMIIKTQSTLLDQLTAKVKELHPYDEPEVVGLPVVGGSASYLKWVTDSTTQ